MDCSHSGWDTKTRAIQAKQCSPLRGYDRGEEIPSASRPRQERSGRRKRLSLTERVCGSFFFSRRIKRFLSGFTLTWGVCRVNKSSLAVLQPRFSHVRAFIWWASSITPPHHFTNRHNPLRRTGDTNRCKCIDSPVTSDSGKVKT